jgi:signal transduction histidine kinase
MAIGLLLLGTQELLLGDLTTGVTVWFLVPNFAAMILGARLLALGGVTFTASVIVVVALAKELGWPIIGNEPAPAQEVVMAVSALGSLAIVGAIARISLGARRQLMAEVNRRNAELAEALAGAHAARTLAIEASEAKDRFFANLTHEIRTPLNGIAGTTELLRQTTLGSDQRPLVAALSASTSNLVLLVNAMLDHARLRAGRMSAEPVPVEVRRAATNLELTFRAQATEKGLDFAVTVEEDMPAWIEVDAIKVRQVLGNLVANAIKFTASGSVTVSVGKAPPDPSQALPAMTVLVTDTGEGIAPDKVDRIFEPFMRGIRVHAPHPIPGRRGPGVAPAESGRGCCAGRGYPGPPRRGQ